MNWTAAVGAVAVLIQILGFAWLGGVEKQRGRENTARLDQHDTWLLETRVRVDGHDVQLAKIEAWREGYNAGCAKKAPHNG